MGKASRRHINGILLLNKATGISSNIALQQIKRLYNANKAGHTGSLDPLATGMLPICLGEATKYAQYLLDADKCYEVTAQLGQVTATGDSEGEILVERDIPADWPAQLERILPSFQGAISQVPPMYSALKHQGKPLYELARQGITVERKERQVTIRQLSLLGQGSASFRLAVKCSKGTYIRTLVQDIGEQLNCGAHVSQLHRCYVAGFGQSTMHSYDELADIQQQQGLESLDHYLLPIDSALQHMPRCDLQAEQVQRLRFGQRVDMATIATDTSCKVDTDQLLRLYAAPEQFIGVGEILNGEQLVAKRLLRTDNLCVIRD